MARVELTYEFIQSAMQSKPVRDALQARARRIHAAASAMDPDADINVESGTRPKGRPYSRVTSDNVEGEWGSSRVDRRRVLGRAADA